MERDASLAVLASILSSSTSMRGSGAATTAVPAVFAAFERYNTTLVSRRVTPTGAVPTSMLRATAYHALRSALLVQRMLLTLLDMAAD